MLAIQYTQLSTDAPTSEELRLKSKGLPPLLKPPLRSGYYKNNYGNFSVGPANLCIICTNERTIWTRDALVQIAARRLKMRQ